jgi:hypothetical protein
VNLRGQRAGEPARSAHALGWNLKVEGLDSISIAKVKGSAADLALPWSISTGFAVHSSEAALR